MNRKQAQFGGIGGQYSPYAPGVSPLMKGHPGASGPFNPIEPGTSFDDRLERAGVVDRPIEEQNALYHQDIEYNTMAYLPQSQRVEVKKQKYKQSRDWNRFMADDHAKTADSDQTEPARFNSIEEMLDQFRLSDPDNIIDQILTKTSGFNLTKEVVAALPADLNMGIFGLNNSAPTIHRTHTSLPFHEDFAKENDPQGDAKFNLPIDVYNTPDQKSQLIETNKDLERYLNSDKVSPLGTQMPNDTSEFSTSEQTLHDYAMPDTSINRTQDEDLWPDDQLDQDAELLLHMMLNDANIPTELKQNYLNQIQKHPSMRLPHLKGPNVNQRDWMGLYDGGPFWQEAEGYYNLHPNNPGAITTNLPNIVR